MQHCRTFRISSLIIFASPCPELIARLFPRYARSYYRRRHLHTSALRVCAFRFPSGFLRRANLDEWFQGIASA